MRKSFARWLAQHHDSTVLRRMHRLFRRLHYAYENFDYDCEQNGERALLERLRGVAPMSTLFDVGANVGEWSRIASELYPDARIHAFEPVDEAHQRLRAEVGGRANVVPVQLALSDAPGETPIYYIPGGEALATCMEGFIETFHGVEPMEKRIRLNTGDRYCREHGIERIDFLKIDAEGSDCRVLAGFEDMFAQGRIRMVQFEYGVASIVTKFLLKDFYEFFEARNMVVGKVYPSHVDFRRYSYQDEDFIGPNYVAVQADLQPEIEALAAKR